MTLKLDFNGRRADGRALTFQQRLMTHMWRKNLGKDADVLFTVPVGVPFWTSGQFEPLIVAIVFPLSPVPRYTGPWLVKGTDEGA